MSASMSASSNSAGLVLGVATLSDDDAGYASGSIPSHVVIGME